MKNRDLFARGLSCLVGYEPPKFRFEQGASLGKCEVMAGAAMGMHSYMNSGFIRGGVIIGRYCSIGRNVTIGSGAHDLTALSTNSFFKKNSNPQSLKLADPVKRIRVLIGHDVWIGDNAYIMSAVTVGNGAVIASGAIVTKNVEPYSIVVGLPAKHLKWRFPEAIRARLAALRWHEFDTRLLQDVDIGNIESCLDEMEKWPASSRIHKNIEYQQT